MFLSTLYLSISRSIDGGRAFSTLEIWSCVFQSREFHPCALVPCFPVPSIPPLRFGPTFSSPAFSASPSQCGGRAGIVASQASILTQNVGASVVAVFVNCTRRHSVLPPDRTTAPDACPRENYHSRHIPLVTDRISGKVMQSAVFVRPSARLLPLSTQSFEPTDLSGLHLDFLTLTGRDRSSLEIENQCHGSTSGVKFKASKADQSVAFTVP